ncbi:MAG: 50S ribosomal protein L9 [Acidobacteria bacterium]|nr:50S ribosomal protein L9 [Acidobacteriota bacterium]
MKVLLKQDVEKLGKAGDIVKVAAGYGRNFLIPRRMATEATPGNIKMVEQERRAQARRDYREKEAANLLAQDIVKLTATIKRKTGEGGSLYGSVTAMDIADFLSAHKVDIDKRKIQLDEPIKTVGEYRVSIRLHREVTVPIRVIVEPETEQEPESPPESEDAS